MMHFRKILFPFDFSEAAKAMAPTVVAMAKRFHASVTVLHAFNMVRNYDLAPRLDGQIESEPEAVPYTPELQALRDRSEGQLKEFARARLSDIRWTSKIEDGDPATVIEWAAMHEQSELIMMPTRGLGRFRRMLLGSVAAKVIHDVDCPVFTSAHEPFSPMSSQGDYRSILCAARFDPESEATLKMARFLADIYRARVCLLYIHSSSDARSEDEATQFIRHAFEQTGADGLDSSESTCVRILDASVSEGIRQTAIEKEADLLIVGRRHFRGDVSWIWSSLYTIICESPCPVLTV